MKTSKSTRFLPLLLLLLISACSTKTEMVGFARAIRIPEHTCKKRFNETICEPERCQHQCTKREPFGVGKCNGNMCVCSYYCKLPPM
ncbi:putative defensin-like protein [Helianthus anomalus]|nr:hypothetical protein HanPSC8_Chr14g0613001 [Helianthus annuus]